MYKTVRVGDDRDRAEFRGCMMYQECFPVPITHPSFARCVMDFIRINKGWPGGPGTWHLRDGRDTTSGHEYVRGLIFTIKADGSFHQGWPESAPQPVRITHWPPKEQT